MTDEYYAEVNIDEEIYCNNVINLNDFKINTIIVNGRQKITGFKFKFNYPEEIDFDKNFDHTLLKKIVFHYLDFLSSITLYPLNKSYYSTKIFDLNGKRLVTINVDTLIPMRTDVDIDLSKFPNTLSNLSNEKIEYFRYYYAGVLFYINRLYEFSIREFFKIIETDTSIPRYQEYKTIRHLFSHHTDRLNVASQEFMNSNLEKVFKYDKIKDQKNNEIVIIDRYHPKNIQLLLRMAKELKEIVEPRVLN